MDKEGGLLQLAIATHSNWGCHVHPVARTYSVMIILVYPFSLVVQQASVLWGINMEICWAFGLEIHGESHLLVILRMSLHFIGLLHEGQMVEVMA